MRRILLRWAVVSSLAPMLLGVSSAMAQEKGKAKSGEGNSPKAVSRDNQRVSGAILKVESIRSGARPDAGTPAREDDRPLTYRVTINPAVVWRDWVRDQAGVKPDATPREVANRGANSVATKGEPATEGSLVVVDVEPATKIETRYRESTDETSKGGRTPAEGRAATEDPASSKTEKASPKGTEKQAEALRLPRFRAEDLRPGVFVEVDYARKEGQDVASTLTVLLPIGGSDTSDRPVGGQEKEKAKAKQ